MHDFLLVPLALFSIPILGICAGIISSVLKSQERRLELRLQMQQGQNDQVNQQIAALRAEIASLRDTSTQYAISLEHTVQRLEERVTRIESTASARIVSSLEPEQQRVGVR